MKRKKIKNNQGVTLIELIISISLLTIILIASFNFINITKKFNVKSEKDIQELIIAQTVGEEIRGKIKNNSLNLEHGQWENYNNQTFLENDFKPEYVVEYNVKEIFNRYIVEEVEDSNNSNKEKLFEVKILLYRQKKIFDDNKYLYTVDIRVSNKNISNKITKLRYQVFR